jgi:hypothetical protein
MCSGGAWVQPANTSMACSAILSTPSIRRNRSRHFRTMWWMLLLRRYGMIEDHIRRLRAQLLRTLGLATHETRNLPEIPVSRSVLTDLGFVEIAVEELRPRHMRGCGAVPEDAIGGLNEVVDELRVLLDNIIHSIREELELDQKSNFRECEKEDKEE